MSACNPDSDIVISAVIDDGYSLRHLIEYLKDTGDKGNFVFTKSGIKYVQAECKVNLLNEVVIHIDKIPEYIFNSQENEVVIGVSLPDLKKVLKIVSKKESVEIYQIRDEHVYYIRNISSNIKDIARSSATMCTPQRIKISDNVCVPPFDRTAPNCKIPIADFDKMCTAMYTVSCTNVIFRGYQDGIICEGITESRIIGRVETFGNTPLENGSKNRGKDKSIEDKNSGPGSGSGGMEDTDGCVMVSISKIKAFKKLKNVAGSKGIVQVFMQKGMPLKLVVNVGIYGELTIYYREADKK